MKGKLVLGPSSHKPEGMNKLCDVDRSVTTAASDKLSVPPGAISDDGISRCVLEGILNSAHQTKPISTMALCD